VVARSIVKFILLSQGKWAWSCPLQKWTNLFELLITRHPIILISRFVAYNRSELISQPNLVGSLAACICVLPYGYLPTIGLFDRCSTSLLLLLRDVGEGGVFHVANWFSEALHQLELFVEFFFGLGAVDCTAWKLIDVNLSSDFEINVVVCVHQLVLLLRDTSR